MLSDQGSNLDSSEPKSDVLPVTPSDKHIPFKKEFAKIVNIFHIKNITLNKEQIIVKWFFPKYNTAIFS